MTEQIDGLLKGTAAPELAAVIERLEAELVNDPDYSFQAAAYRDGELVLDVWGGPHLKADSLIVPWSVTKGTIGFSTALLVERGELDLDENVAHYWPEFAAKGKQDVTVRQLLSHQAGLPEAQPPLTPQEQLDPHEGARRLAETRPYWRPGSAFGYHPGTIGNLAAELVFRVTGQTLHEFYENEIRRPRDIDFYLGLPPALDHRLFEFLPPVTPPGAAAPHNFSPMQRLVFAPPAEGFDFGRDEVSWRYGHPAGSGTGSARGIASLYAAGTTGIGEATPFLSRDTVEIFAQQQVRGYDEVLGQAHRAHGVVFQKPTPTMPLGGERAFGHDGAFGGLGWADPDTGVALGYIVARGSWPGGLDSRAIELASTLLDG